MLEGDFEAVEKFVKDNSDYGPLICAVERIKKELAVGQKPTTNSARDAIAAWENHCKQHLKGNGPACDITNDEMCKHWFIMGYNA